MLKTLRLLREYKHQPWTLSDKAKEQLRQFQGFGNHKDFLSPLSELSKEVNAIVAETYPDNTAEVMRQLRSSTLSSFYTPQVVVEAMSEALNETFDRYNFHPQTFLDPSAGTGAFLSLAPEKCKKYLVEKDIVTADILHMLTRDNPTVAVKNIPFETISNYMDHPSFDLIASNIPFGNYQVFDLTFHQKGGVYRESLQRIHNYYFVKSAELLNDNGILAFITTRAVCDTESNKPIRKHLVKSLDLVSAVRLPDNLFKCGVGTDLLIFRKDKSKTKAKAKDKLFVNGTLFESESGHILATETKETTDRFGKPSVIHLWK